MPRTHDARRSVASGCGLLGALALVLVATSAFFSSPAAAQAGECLREPYSGGDLCPPPPGAECELDQQLVDAGSRIRIQGRGFVPGQTLTGFFDGEKVFEVRTEDGTFDQTFTVPPRRPGRYNVVVRAANGQECDPPVTVGGVRASRFARDEDAAGEQGTRNGRSGSLLGSPFARTGMTVGLFVLTAVVLIVTGLALRRHRRRPPTHHPMWM